MDGVIRRLVTDKGYGFIRGNAGKTEYFFHAEDLRGLIYNDLAEGDKVSFDPTSEEKGPRARNVEEIHVHVIAEDSSL